MIDLPVHFGVDYYPEHWPAELLDSDIDRIVALGVTMIRVGEFAWHLMEPRDGEYDFSYFDHVLDVAHGAGLSVLFGTPTATFPAWLAAKHPQILSQDEHGHVRVFGGRRQYCYNSPVYREHAARITEQVVGHFAEHPAVVAWQVDNELGHEGSDDCYCPACAAAWREWLLAKYGDVGALNERWGTIFWGQTYNDVAEIPVPVPTITTHSPALKLDWARFRSDSLNGFADDMIAIVRQHRRADQLVTHNLPGGFFGKLWDHARTARDLDVVSYDNYPVWGGLKEPMPPAEIAMTLDFMRSLQNRNFWIVEQLMGAQGHDVIGYLPRPGQAAMWAYQAFGHGCELMLWFRYRAMNRGAEQFCYGVIDHDDRPGRKYEEVRAAIADLQQYERVWKSQIAAEVAVVYDMDTVWSWRGQRQSADFDFTAELMRAYAPFHRRNAAIDVRPARADLSGYRILALPVPQIVDEDLVARLTEFVAGGGTLLLTFRAGLRNRDNAIHFGLPLPGPLRGLAGIEVVEVEALQEPVPVSGELGQGQATVWRDLIDPGDADVLLSYGDAPYAQRACVTRHAYGAGAVYYVGAGIDGPLMGALVDRIVVETGIVTVESPDGVEVCTRGQWHVVTNHTAAPVTFRGRELGPYGAAVIGV